MVIKWSSEKKQLYYDKQWSHEQNVEQKRLCKAGYLKKSC